MLLRRFERRDLRAAVELWAAAFDVELPDEQARQRSLARLAFGLQTDPLGAFVAERAGRLIGLSQTLRRERLCVLTALAVEPGCQSQGAGRRLLERALRYGADADGQLIVSSNDPRAIALYARMGFEVRPTVQAQGTIDLRTPSLPGVRAAGPREVPGLAELSRAIRGAPHTAEILHALKQGGKLLLSDGGFAVARPGQGVWLLVAREEAAARALLWNALALVGSTEIAPIRWITEDQRWALELAEEAGLALSPYGALCVKGTLGPLRPFIPSGSFA